MDPLSLKRRLLFRGCRLVTRMGPYVLVEKDGRRAVIPMHRGDLPRALVRRIGEYLEVDVR